MAEFDERWKRLVAAARIPREPPGELVRLPPRAPSERRSLLALAALLACALLSLVPWRDEVGGFARGAIDELAALPARVPRPPHPPSGASALAALLDLSPFTKDSPP
jgi:hypothetical protein